MPRLILGLVGEAGAGKGTVADYLRERHGATVHSLAKPLHDIAARLHLPRTRDTYIRLSECLRAEFGETLLSTVAAGDLAADASPLIVVEPLRRLQDIAELSPLPGFHLVNIAAEPRARYERMVKRGEKAGESEMSYEQFLAEAHRSTELSIKEVAARAEASIDNNGSREELQAGVERVLSELGYAGPDLAPR